MWVATLDLPAETASYCLERIYTGDDLGCVDASGLQSTELLSPQSGDEIGAQFETEWAVQATGSAPESQLQHALFYFDPARFCRYPNRKR